MALKLVSLTWDSINPARLARFWASALEWQLSDDDVTVLPTDGTTFDLVFNPTVAEPAGRNRIHLDLSSQSLEDQRATVARYIDLGAP